MTEIRNSRLSTPAGLLVIAVALVALVLAVALGSGSGGSGASPFTRQPGLSSPFGPPAPFAP